MHPQSPALSADVSPLKTPEVAISPQLSPNQRQGLKELLEGATDVCVSDQLGRTTVTANDIKMALRKIMLLLLSYPASHRSSKKKEVVDAEAWGGPGPIVSEAHNLYASTHERP